MVTVGNGLYVLANVSLPLLTKPEDHTKIQVILHEKCPTNPYQNSRIVGVNHWWFWFGHSTYYHCLPYDRSEFDPLPTGLYQSLPPRRRHNTHLIRVCVMLGYNGLWLISMAYWWGYDRHLYDVGVLWVRLAIIVYELLCLAYGMEVERVLA